MGGDTRGLVFASSLPLPRTEARFAFITLAGSVLIYVAAFAWLQGVIGAGAAALATVPVAVAGWYFGVAAGLGAAFLSVPLNTLLLFWFGFTGWELMVKLDDGVSTSIFLIVGIVAGGLGKMNRKFADQSLNLAMSQQALDVQAALRVKVEGDLDLSESLLATVLDSAEEAIVSIDDAQRIVVFNRGAEKMFGYRAREVIGRPLDMLIPERFVAAHQANVDGFAAGTHATMHMGNDSVVFGRRKDGTELPVEVSLSKSRIGDQATYTAILRDVTRRVQAEEAERLRSRELEALVSVLSISVKPGSLEEKAKRVLKELARMVQVEDAGLRYLDEKEGGLRLIAQVHSHPGQEDVQALAVLPYEDGVNGEVIKQGHVIVANDYATHPLAMPRAVEHGIRSLAALPVRFADQTFGTLTVWSRELDHFTDERVRLLAAVADEVGTLLENTRLQEQEQTYTREREALLNIASILAQTGTMESKSAGVLDELVAVVQADRAVMRLANDQRKELGLVAVSSPSMPEIPTQKSIPIDNGLPGMVVRQGETIVVNDYVSHTLAMPRNIEYGIRSAAYFPIKTSGQILGSVTVSSKQANYFTHDRVRLLATIVAELGVLLQSTLLIDRLRQSHAELTQRETDLREAQGYNQRLLASLPNAVVVVDDDLRVLFANKAFYRDLGLRKKSTEGKLLSNIGRLDGIARLAQSAFRSKGSNREKEIIYRHPRKGRRWFRVWASDLEKGSSLDGGGKRHLVLSLEDVTEWQRVQEKVQETSRLISLGEIIGGVAHELNNPLTSVMGFSQLLMEQEKDGPNYADLKMIFNESQRAAKVVSNLLAFVRRREIDKQWVAVSDPLERVLALKSYDLRVGNIDVECVLEPDLPPVFVDEHQLEQVFLNLVTNGQQAMVTTNNRGCLTIRAQRKNDSVLVSFADDGPGIPSADLSSIFDPFFTTKGPEQGTGLGLSICQGLVQEQGGKIWAESEEGKGAVIYVELSTRAKSQ